MPKSVPEQDQPLSPEPPSPPTDKRTDLSRFFVWALFAAALLGVAIAALLYFSPASPAPHLPVAVSKEVSPAIIPAKNGEETPPASETLTVTLSSAGAGKHVRVGIPVMISAYTSLPPGAGATVSISYTRNHGPESLLALVQGSLATVSWTPALPGRYEFTASALDSRKNSAASRPVLIAAEAAPASLVPLPVLPVVVSPPPPVQVAAAVPQDRPARKRVRKPAQRPSPPPAVKRPSILKISRVSKAHRISKAYHVAAGAFIVRPVAETLAGALRRRGLHATVRPGPLLYRKPSYVVETGSYLNSADADRQRDALKHDGYPAYIFRP